MEYDRLIHNIIKRGYLKTPEIIEAFKNVDRADFVRQENLPESYEDYPLPIGDEQTISQPSTVAFMIELLQPREGNIVLDIGSGSGWTAAILAEIVGEKGFVYGLELVPELVEFGRDNIIKHGTSNADILQSDLQQLGMPDKGPFDRILVSAAGYDLPEELVKQLKVGGRMVIPISDTLWLVEKISKDETREEKYPGFAFVPLKY